MIRPLHTALQEKAEREINETANRIPSDTLALREWLEKQPHLQSVKPSDQLLVGFLRGSKFSLERSKNKLDMYYTLRTIVPEIFRERNPFDPNIQDILQSGFYLPLKDCCAEDAPRIAIARFKMFDSSKHKLTHIIKVIFMIIEILILEDDNFVIAGKECLVDMKDTGIGVFMQWTPALAKKVILSVEKAMPLRIKGAHFFNLPPAFDSAFALLKSLVGNGLKNRFHLHTQNFDALYQIFPRYLLPKEYDGETGSINDLIDHWKAKVESYSDWFLREEDQCSDESLRPEKPVTSSSLFGIEGSFRKLEVD